MNTNQKNTDRVCITYRELSIEEKSLVLEIKASGAMLLDLFDTIGDDGAINLAKIKIEEAIMWAVKYTIRDRKVK